MKGYGRSNPEGGIKKCKILKWEWPGVFQTNKEVSVNYGYGFIVLGLFALVLME